MRALQLIRRGSFGIVVFSCLSSICWLLLRQNLQVIGTSRPSIYQSFSNWLLQDWIATEGAQIDQEHGGHWLYKVFQPSAIASTAATPRMAFTLGQTAYISPNCHSYHDAETAGNLTDRYRLLPERINGPYLLAMVLQDEEALMLDYLSTIVFLTDFLGNKQIHVSIIQQSSSDRTKWYLDLFEAIFTSLDLQFTVLHDPELAFNELKYFPSYQGALRNHALRPLFAGTKFRRVIWLKGSICRDDVLELLHQSFIQEATITCGIDLILARERLRFHDTWVAKDLDGKPFGSDYELGAHHIVRDSQNVERLQKGLPFQVFCCASGTHVVNTDNVFYVKSSIFDSMWRWISRSAAKNGIRYRGESGEMAGDRTFNNELVPPSMRDEITECSDSELSGFCRDLWIVGRGKVMVVPRVKTVYDKQTADFVRDKEAAGWRHAIHVNDLESAGLWWTTSWTGHAADTLLESFVRWRRNPPESIECREVQTPGSKQPSGEVKQVRLFYAERMKQQEHHEWYPCLVSPCASNV